MDAGTLEGKRIETPAGPRYLVKREQEVHRCSYPDCPELAPGRSSRCGIHPAGVKDPSERRDCERCGDDLGVIPGNRIKAGRGKYWAMSQEKVELGSARGRSVQPSRVVAR